MPYCQIWKEDRAKIALEDSTFNSLVRYIYIIIQGSLDLRQPLWREPLWSSSELQVVQAL